MPWKYQQHTTEYAHCPSYSLWPRKIGRTTTTGFDKATQHAVSMHQLNATVDATVRLMKTFPCIPTAAPHSQILHFVERVEDPRRQHSQRVLLQFPIYFVVCLGGGKSETVSGGRARNLNLSSGVFDCNESEFLTGCVVSQFHKRG